MPLAKRTIDIPLGGGLEAKVDPKLVPIGKSIVLENAEFAAPGSINKRNGYTALSKQRVTGADIAAGTSMHKYRDSMVLLDGQMINEYSPTAGKWQGAQKLQCCSVRNVGIPSTLPSYSPSTVYPTAAETAVANGILVYAYSYYDGAHYGAIDVSTGSVVVADTVVTNLNPPQIRVVASGNIIYVIAQGNLVGTDELVMTYLNTSSPTAFAAQSVIANAVNDQQNVDVAALDASGNCVAVYSDNSSGQPTVLKFSSAGAGASASAGVAGNYCGIAVSAAGHIYVAWHRTSNDRVRVTVMDSSLAPLFSSTDLDTTTGSLNFAGAEESTNVMTFYYTILDGVTGQYHVRKNTVTSAGVIGTASVVLRGAFVVSKAIRYSSTTYLATAYASGSAGTQSGYYLIDGAGSIVARYFPDAGMTFDVYDGTFFPMTSPFAQVSTGVYRLGTTYGSTASLLIDDYFTQPTIVEFDFGRRPVSAEFGKNLLISTGGMLWEYDGADAFENNFFVYPEEIVATQGVGGSLADGTYSVSACYASFDANGNLHRGPPSPPIAASITGGGGTATIELAMPNLRMTNRASVFILAYVADVGSTTYYEVGVVPNDPTTDTQIVIIATMVGLTDNRRLYTTGGVLENTAPPALQSIVRKGRRVYGVDHEGVINYTKEHVPNEPASFVRETLVRDPGDDDREHVLAEMDGRLINIGDTHIFVLVGEGATDTGTLDTLSEPQEIATDLGAVTNSPVVMTPVGIMYKSKRGIVLLDRSLTPQLIGAPVDTYRSLTTVSAVLVPNKNQVRFGHSDGVTLVYDYLIDQWSVFTNHTQAAAVLFADRYCFVTSAGQVYQQSTGYEDGASAITMAVETPWIHVGAIQGLQRIYYIGLLGTWRSSHTLTIKTYLNHNQTVVGTYSFSLTTGITVGDALDARVHVGSQCSALKLRIEDSSQADSKESMTLSGLTLEAGGKGGVFRTSTTSVAPPP